MISQQALVNHNALSDGSTTYDVVLFDGNKRITIYAIDSHCAMEIASALNGGANAVAVDVL